MIHQYATEIATEIRLTRSQHSGSFLVVEGRDDRLFMEGFTCSVACRIMVVQGKQNVCEVIRILDESNFDGVLGLVDADFDRVASIPSRGPNILMPEYHDLETMLLCSPALDRILIEFGSQTKLETFGEDVLDGLISRALPLGYLRLYSMRNELGLTFDGLNYSAWIDRASFHVHATRLINEVKNRSQRQNLPADTLETAIQQLENAGYHPREVCNGTDLIEILSIGLLSVLGTNATRTVSGNALRRYLRLAYTEQYFAMSTLGRDIRVWESQSTGYQVLRR